MRGIVDTHAHYADKRFFEEYEGGAAALLQTLFSSDVEKIINMATSLTDVGEVLSQAASYDGMFAAVGIHPTEIDHASALDKDMGELRALLDVSGEKKIVAVGEIGLDYYHKPFDRELQNAYFDAQLRLAEEYSLPVSVHDREAHGDVFDAILAHPRVRGVVHSYSGSAEMARELVRRGWYVSFSGVITFKNAVRLREVAISVPIDRILLETDCPYLAPVPHRGELNHSGNIAYSAAALADILGTSVENVYDVCARNAEKLFGI